MSPLQLLDRENQNPGLPTALATHLESGGWLANLTIQGTGSISAQISLRAPARTGDHRAQGRRARELEWRRTHAQTLRQYRGQWVALEGERIIAHGRSPAEVIEEARASGVEVPYIFFVEDLPEGAATLGV